MDIHESKDLQAVLGKDGIVNVGSTPLGHLKICAVSRLRWRGGYLAATWNALIGWQCRAALDLPDEQIKGTLGVRLDEFERGERVFVRLDMVSVLHLVQPVRRR